MWMTFSEVKLQESSSVDKRETKKPVNMFQYKEDEDYKHRFRIRNSQSRVIFSKEEYKDLQKRLQFSNKQYQLGEKLKFPQKVQQIENYPIFNSKMHSITRNSTKFNISQIQKWQSNYRNSIYRNSIYRSSIEKRKESALNNFQNLKNSMFSQNSIYKNKRQELNKNFKEENLPKMPAYKILHDSQFYGNKSSSSVLLKDYNENDLRPLLNESFSDSEMKTKRDVFKKLHGKYGFINVKVNKHKEIPDLIFYPPDPPKLYQRAELVKNNFQRRNSKEEIKESLQKLKEKLDVPTTRRDLNRQHSGYLENSNHVRRMI